MNNAFEALSDETRRNILVALQVAADQENADSASGVSVGSLVEALNVSQPTVSKHLKVLREAGLVDVREEGQKRFYYLNSSGLWPVYDWIDGFFPEPEAKASAASGVGYTTFEPNTEAAEKVGRVIGEAAGQVAESAKNIADRIGHPNGPAADVAKNAVTKVAKFFGRN